MSEKLIIRSPSLGLFWSGDGWKRWDDVMIFDNIESIPTTLPDPLYYDSELHFDKLYRSYACVAWRGSTPPAVVDDFNYYEDLRQPTSSRCLSRSREREGNIWCRGVLPEAW